MASLDHDDGIEILATSNTMTSKVCTTSHVIDLGLTLVSATTDFFLTLNDLEATVMTSSLLRSRSRCLDETRDFDSDPTLKQL